MTLPETGSGEAEALYRRYVFPGFRSAMRFMASSAELIHERDHHPRWQNIGRTLDIWLTTFDIGKRVTAHDAALAKGIQAIYAAGKWRRPPAATAEMTDDV